jgi:glucans biosynthesis protein
MLTLDRRTLIAAGLSMPLIAAAPLRKTAPPPVGPNFGPARPFSFADLVRRAKRMADEPYRAPPTAMADILSGIDFDMAQKIRFRPDYALRRGSYPVALFHLNRYAAEPVRIFAVSGGMAREVLYSPTYFDYGGTGIDAKLPANAGFSGFRVMDGPKSATDWLASRARAISVPRGRRTNMVHRRAA